MNGTINMSCAPSPSMWTVAVAAVPDAPAPVLDSDGSPVLDSSGNPVFDS